MKKLAGYFILLVLFAAWSGAGVYLLGVLGTIILLSVMAILVGLIYVAVTLIVGEN